MNEMNILSSKPFKEEFDFDSPENVLIEVIPNEFMFSRHWKGFSIDTCTVISGKEDVTGAASYEYAYGGFLNYTIEDMIDCPGEGWFVVEGITGYYSKGDGWMTDDDMEFYYEKVRPATQDEIDLA